MIVAPYDARRTPAAIVLPVVIEGAASGFSTIMGMEIDVLAERSVLAASIDGENQRMLIEDEAA